MRISDWSSDVCSSDLDLDVARGQVQDRLSRVESRLPQEVRQLGIAVTKASSGFLMLIALQSDRPDVTTVEMGNFASNNILNELRRIHGVGDVQLFGSPYAIRLWMDESKLAGSQLSAVYPVRAVPIGRASGRDRGCQ